MVENLVLKESEAKKALMEVTIKALHLALKHSHGAALVNLAESAESQEEIVDHLPEYFHHVTVAEILEKKALVPAEKKGLVVSGYSWDFYVDKDKEERIEAFVRTVANMRRCYEGRFQILVLMNGLPEEKIWCNADLPWFNGPFEDEAVWSIRPMPQGSGVELIQHKLEIKERRSRTWGWKRKFSVTSDKKALSSEEGE